MKNDKAILTVLLLFIERQKIRSKGLVQEPGLKTTFLIKMKSINFKVLEILYNKIVFTCIIVYCLLNDKKYAQKVWFKDLVYKKPFGYRVIHQNSLTSCPGLLNTFGN